MKAKSESEVAQLCPTVSDPMDCSPPGSSVHGICQARVPELGASAFSIFRFSFFFFVTAALDRGKYRKVTTLDGEYFQAGNWASYHLDEKQTKNWNLL